MFSGDFKAHKRRMPVVFPEFFQAGFGVNPSAFEPLPQRLRFGALSDDGYRKPIHKSMSDEFWNLQGEFGECGMRGAECGVYQKSEILTVCQKGRKKAVEYTRIPNASRLLLRRVWRSLWSAVYSTALDARLAVPPAISTRAPPAAIVVAMAAMVFFRRLYTATTVSLSSGSGRGRSHS